MGMDVRHVLHVLRYAARRPLVAMNGAREFRLAFTTHYDDHDELESYDSGRELAHMLTFRYLEH